MHCRGLFFFLSLPKHAHMAKTIKYHFYLKDKESSVPTPINLVIRKVGHNFKKSTGESILPEHWDFNNETAIVSTAQKKNEIAIAKRVRKNLAKLRIDLDDLLEGYEGIDKLTPNHNEGIDVYEELFRRIEGIIDHTVATENEEAKRSKMTPTEFFENVFFPKWKEARNPRTSQKPSSGTMFNYKNTIRRYKDFINDEGLKDSFSIFDENFQQKFDKYLEEEQELTPNTVSSTHSQLKVMLRMAYDEQLLHSLAFTKLTTKTKKFRYPYLDDEELNRLMELVITPELKEENKIGEFSHIEETRDLFIISARTGLRYSDLKSLNTAQWDIEEDGQSYITINIQKTKSTLKIPLHRNVLYIYNKYKGVFPMPVDKSHFNSQLRQCARLARITKSHPYFGFDKNGDVVSMTKEKWELIGSHTGRRSFCTNLFLTCHSAKLVMNLSGHKSEDNFNRYISIGQSEMAKEAAPFINLEQMTDKETTNLVNTLKEDALIIDKQNRRISELEESLKNNSSDNDIIREIQIAKDHINDIKGIWQMVNFKDEQFEGIWSEAKEYWDVIQSQERKLLSKEIESILKS